MDWINITKKQPFIFYGLFFCLSVLTLGEVISGIFGFLVLLGLFLCQINFIKAAIDKYEDNSPFLFSFFAILIYDIISLSLLYYLFGLSRLVLFFWLVFTTIIIISFLHKESAAAIKCLFLPSWSYAEKFLSKPHFLLIAAGAAYLLSSFASNPVLNGSPTPWANSSFFNFIVFLIISLVYLSLAINGNKNILVGIIYFFVIITVIAIKYTLSYGYDTLLHQAALKYISHYSQIKPLTPFYIGQYVSEVLLHFFTRWDFVVIERWLAPVLFILVLMTSSIYLLKRLKFKNAYLIIPITALFLIPDQFTYTSPYVCSLILGIAAIIFLYIFLIDRCRIDFYCALFLAIASALIHPFIGLNILACIIGAWFYANETNKFKLFFVLLLTFLAASLIVFSSFGAYNWLRGGVLILADPFYYAYKFLSLFNDPVWYSRTSYSLWLAIIYFFEKIHFFLIFFGALLFAMCDKERRKANIFILLISISAIASAWFFISSLEVSGYGYGDQVNYSYRLLQSGKWILWPLILFAFVKIFNFIKSKSEIFRVIFILATSLTLTICWYLTYPRNDDISKINVNNIREVDYKAIDLIYERENGKKGYLVFANQLFGAGAIQKYSFEPYYKTKWGEIFYYSIPMGGELNKRFEEIMSAENFNADLIYEALREAGLRKAYFVVADYWPLAPEVTEEMENSCTDHWNIEDHKIDIYFFETK